MKASHLMANPFGKRMKILSAMAIMALLLIVPQEANAHCDSYDGPVIKDALKGLEINQVEPVLKWIKPEHEEEIKNLFDKTISLKGADAEIYVSGEKYFLETLVRLHREGEGAPYTGLKPAGTTKPIVVLTDKALIEGNIDGLSAKVKAHFDKVLKEKYEMVLEKSKSKEESAEKGREYVEAYVDYTHFLEALHDVIEYGSGGHGHQH
jgi:hypothetical protein